MGFTRVDRTQQVGGHSLVRCIGRGAYGEVWLAADATGKYCAAKIVRRKNFDQPRPFEREFEGMRKFEAVSQTHPGLLRIHGVTRDDVAGYFYCLMEVADDLHRGQQIDPATYTARTLAAVMRQAGRLPFQDCLRISLALTSALGHLHRHGLIHRDIKPANIIFVHGVPKFADIGLVTEAGEGVTVVGSPAYMAPEGPGKPAADMYSLGIVLYELFTGKTCLDFPELPTTLVQAASTQRLLQATNIILGAAERDPGRRYQTVDQLHAALSALNIASAG